MKNEELRMKNEEQVKFIRFNCLMISCYQGLRPKWYDIEIPRKNRNPKSEADQPLDGRL